MVSLRARRDTTLVRITMLLHTLITCMLVMSSLYLSLFHPTDSCHPGSVYSWLSSLGLLAYVDNFSQQGLCHMFELNDFTLEVCSSFFSMNLSMKMIKLQEIVSEHKHAFITCLLRLFLYVVSSSFLYPKYFILNQNYYQNN